MDNDNFIFIEQLAQQEVVQPKVEIRKMLSFSTQTDLEDVPDPYYGGDSGFENVLDLLEDACEGLLEELSY